MDEITQLPRKLYTKIQVLDMGFSTHCWVWVGAKHREGYGHFYVGRKSFLAHRVVWLAMRGEIPSALECDHLCRVRPCVNPAHIELVTHAENVARGDAPHAINARKTHCKRGHELSGDNLYESGLRRGARQCRKCRLEDVPAAVAAERQRRKEDPVYYAAAKAKWTAYCAKVRAEKRARALGP